MAATTTGYYRTVTRDFLIHCFGNDRVDLGAICASDIIGFVRYQARRIHPRAHGRKRISPHVLRHTTVMDLLQVGVGQAVIAL